MGFTHYWTQTKAFSKEEWLEVKQHVGEIINYVETFLGVPLADGFGEGGTRPVLSDKYIAFNGLGNDAHETFRLSRTRTKLWDEGEPGSAFCKTANKPYDVAVTACLCYLSSVADALDVSTDGTGHDFLAGLDAARKALPAKANILDIPMSIMRKDRWTGPWVRGENGSGYRVDFCINKMGYVTHLETGAVYSAPREELAQFLDANKTATFRTEGKTSFGYYGKVEPNIWDATGSFDKARCVRIAKAQGKALAKLFPADAEHSQLPPAYVRPNDMPSPDQADKFCYSLDELLSSVAVCRETRPK